MAQEIIEKIVKELAIKERIALLEKEREDFIIEANNKVAAYNGAIGELKHLIEPKPEPELAPAAAAAEIVQESQK